MKCPECRANMKEGRTTLPFELDMEKVIIVRKIPARICEQCAEAFVNILTTKKIEIQS